MLLCRKSDTRITWTECLECYISTSFLNMQIWRLLYTKSRKHILVCSSCGNKYVYISWLHIWLRKTEKRLCSWFTCHFFNSLISGSLNKWRIPIGVTEYGTWLPKVCDLWSHRQEFLRVSWTVCKIQRERKQTKVKNLPQMVTNQTAGTIVKMKQQRDNRSWLWQTTYLASLFYLASFSISFKRPLPKSLFYCFIPLPWFFSLAFIQCMDWIQILIFPFEPPLHVFFFLI